MVYLLYTVSGISVLVTASKSDSVISMNAEAKSHHGGGGMKAQGVLLCAHI